MRSPYRLLAYTRAGVFTSGVVAGALALVAGMMMAEALMPKQSHHYYSPKIITDRIAQN
ncbi:hypothetical protein [Rhodoligotrophos ferricapiens]|uniref:hypothetical protein n=1 Tax=Rhodoligotrophos ferricapiens TaxID=3069264 RepID=UPI00315D57FE